MQEWRALFPSSPQAVREARRGVAMFARVWFGTQALGDIESSVGEALANCVEHGHQAGGEIDVRCSFDGWNLCIDIKDGGAGFVCCERPDTTLLPAGAPRGYGIFIMNRLMDGVEYLENGTRVRLLKRLTALPAERRSAAT